MITVFFLVLYICDLFVSISFKTSSFLICSVRCIPSMFLSNHISFASRSYIEGLILRKCLVLFSLRMDILKHALPHLLYRHPHIKRKYLGWTDYTNDIFRNFDEFKFTVFIIWSKCRWLFYNTEMNRFIGSAAIIVISNKYIFKFFF